MFSILIKTVDDFALDLKRVELLSQKILGRCFNKQAKVELSIFFVDEKFSHQLNLKLRQKDEPASVLTFCLQEQAGQAINFNTSPDGVLRLGDMVISPPVMDKKGLSLEEILKHGIKSLLSRVPAEKLQGFGYQRNP